jgi:leader peptidase (prepilin peptidase) / N-methyltransferase
VPQVAVVLATAAGLAGGAWVPLAAYRLSVPADEPDRDRCAQCGRHFTSGLAGWVALPARCGGCATGLGPPAWLTGLVAGVASGLVAAVAGPEPILPLLVALCIFGTLLGVIDLACHRLPHALVVPAVGVSYVFFVLIAGLTGSWSSLIRALCGAALLGTAFLVLFLLPGRGLGFGDVKLAVLLGGFLGWLGWREVLLGGLLPWLVNAPVVIALLVLGRIRRDMSLPFGPAMLVGTLLSIMAGGWLDLVGRP